MACATLIAWPGMCPKVRESSDAAGVRDWLQRRVPGSIRDDQHHPSWRQLRLSAARRTGVQAGEPDLRSPERGQHLARCGFPIPSCSTSAFRCRTRHSRTGRVSRAWRSPTALSIAASGGLNFRAPSCLATSRADDCSTRGWRISLPPRTAIPRRWRRTPRSRRTFATLVQERLRLDPPTAGFGAGRPGGPGATPAAGPGAGRPGEPGAAPAPGQGMGRPGGPGTGLAGAPRPFRVELRLATDEAGEIYILTKSDGLIRRVVSIR